MQDNKVVKNLLTRAKLWLGSGENDGEEVIGTGNDARVALLNSIGDNADRERGEEFNDINDDGSTSQFTAPAPLEDAEADAEAESNATELARLAAEQEANEQAAGAAPTKIVRKINGQEVEITDDMIVRAQKVAAADAYLAEAKRLRDEQAQVVKPAPVGNDDDLASIARAIQMGTEEEAVAALRKLQTKNPSTDDFTRKVDERLTFKAAYSQFCDEFKDIVSDPRLKKMAEDADNEMLANGDSRPYAERFAQIGNDLRTWKNNGVVQSKAGAQSKEERKAAAPSAPKVASGKHATAVEEETEESVSDVIGKMAAQRGGPQWMNGAGR